MNCKQCEIALVRRENERPGRFKKREYCSNKCAADHRSGQKVLRNDALILHRVCQVCSEPLIRKRRAGGLVAENRYQFAARRTCGNKCGSELRAKVAGRKRDRQQPAPLVFFPVTLDPLIEGWNRAIIRSRAN
jgi:hypothetical protein